MLGIMKVFLFRHGEVENPKGVFYGRLPGFHLSEIGRTHVQKTAQLLKDKDIKTIYSSPLERAVDTAEILLGELKLKKEDLIIDKHLIESEVSKWQGTDLEEFKRKVVFNFSPRDQKEFERIDHAGARVLTVLNGTIKKAGQNAVVVSHGDPLTGCLINITGDWSFVENRNLNKYVKKGEFVELELKGGKWNIIGYSYDTTLDKKVEVL